MDGVTVMRGCRGDEVFQPLETFFPIIGKIAKYFSNHWKNPPIFSNHWKTFFQSLENFSEPRRGHPAGPKRFRPPTPPEPAANSGLPIIPRSCYGALLIPNKGD
jgi:hypothetical protein